MTNLTSPLMEIAEAPDHFLLQVPPPSRRIITPRFSILFSPSSAHSVTTRIQTTPEALDDTIAEVRGQLREAGFTGNVWHLGPTTRPRGLARHLVERGFVPATRPPNEPKITGMGLSKPPAIAQASSGVEARIVRDVDEYRQVIEIAMKAFNESPEDAKGWYDAVPALWAAQDGVNRYTHLAFLDGRPVGFGFAATCQGAVLLGGSGVLEGARGKGVYRALVAARWDEARRLGHEGLVVHAGAMSRPILERCGFEALCDVEVLEDEPFLKERSAK